MAWVRAVFRDKTVWAEVDSLGRPCAPDRKIPIRFGPAEGAKIYLAGLDNVRFADDCRAEHLPPGAVADLPRTAAAAAADAAPATGAPLSASPEAQAPEVQAPEAQAPRPAAGVPLRPPAPPPARLAAMAQAALPLAPPAAPAAAPAAAPVSAPAVPGSFVPAGVSRETPIRAWTDGACSGNPGPAGAGMLIEIPGQPRIERARALGHSTNNVGELTGILMALEVLEEQGIAPAVPVVVYTDSQYARGVLSLGWKANANPALIADIRVRLRARPGVTLEWVRGHANNAGNERADVLARRGAEESARRR